MYADRLLPHNLDAEEAVIGSLIIDNDAVPGVVTLLSPEDFYRESNRICFAAITEIFQRGDAVDQITLAHQLTASGQLDNAGGMPYLSHLVNITPTSTHAEYYAQAVADMALMRRLYQAGASIANLAYSEATAPDEVLRHAENILYGVRSRRPDAGFVSLREVYDQYLQDQADIADPSLDDPLAPIMTRYGDLDSLLGGLQPSDLIILGARPGLGKSALAVNIALQAARDGRTAGIFSLEMSQDQLGLRILAADAGVDAHRLRLGLLSGPEEQRINDSIGELSSLPVYIDDTPYQGVVAMRGKAHRLAQQSHLDLLIVDYLQLVQGAGRQRGGENRVMEISEISRSLKTLARDLRVPILTCSQLSRLVESRPGHRPQLSDLRDSGSIEQDADIVMFIYREDLYYTPEEWHQHFPDRPYPRNIAEIITAKHRHGPTGSVTLRFQPNLVRFENPAEFQEP